MSWDETWRQMATLLGEALRAERLAPVVMRRW
jgi:hypothetical protein